MENIPLRNKDDHRSAILSIQVYGNHYVILMSSLL